VPASKAARRGNADTTSASAAFVHRNLPLLLLQAREQLMRRFRPILNAHGITEQQWRIVRALLDVDGLEPRQIGEICGISSPSLVGILERMEDFGFVARDRVAHDQRRVRVTLTRKSKKLAERMAPNVEAEYQRMEEELGRELLARLYGDLDAILLTSGQA
jgi:homoprotocatechuate degradation regulator HpaR